MALLPVTGILGSPLSQPGRMVTGVPLPVAATPRRDLVYLLGPLSSAWATRPASSAWATAPAVDGRWIIHEVTGVNG